MDDAYFNLRTNCVAANTLEEVLRHFLDYYYSIYSRYSINILKASNEYGYVFWELLIFNFNEFFFRFSNIILDYEQMISESLNNHFDIIDNSLNIDTEAVKQMFILLFQLIVILNRTTEISVEEYRQNMIHEIPGIYSVPDATIRILPVQHYIRMIATRSLIELIPFFDYSNLDLVNICNSFAELLIR